MKVKELIEILESLPDDEKETHILFEYKPKKLISERWHRAEHFTFFAFSDELRGKLKDRVTGTFWRMKESS